MRIYDLIVIGAGPAGLTASIYASRYRLSNLVIGKQLGGEFATASKVENYPGFISISGLELCEKIAEQVKTLGAEILYKEVGKIEIEEVKSQKSLRRQSYGASATKVKSNNLKFKIHLNNGEVYESKTLIVATGNERQKLNIPGEKEYLGRGVSYCTTCDAPFYKDKTVALIGGADAAVSGAIHTTEYAKLVYIIYRKEQLRAEPAWVEEWKRLEESGKGKSIYNTNIKKILGYKDMAASRDSSGMKILRKNNQQSTINNQQLASDVIGAVELDKPYKGNNILEVDGVFIEIGGVPGTSLLKPLGVELDEAGRVKVSQAMETNISGLFCAGDIVDKSLMQQAIIAMAQGAIAAASVYKFLKGQQAPQIKGVRG